MNFHSVCGFPQEDEQTHQKLADYLAAVQIDGIRHQTTNTDDSHVHMTKKLGNPAVYGYKFIVFLLLYIYALNSASDQCT